MNGEGLSTESGQLGRPWEKSISAVPFRGVANAEVLWQEHPGLSKTSSKETRCSGGKWARGKMIEEKVGLVITL